MTARVRSGGFLREVVFGFVASLIAAAVALTLAFLLPAGIVTRLVIAGLGLTLVLRAIARSDEKTGRIVTLLAWSAIAAGVWLMGASLPIYVLVHVAMAWLARSLFTYSGLVEAGLDFGVTVLALCFAVFAAVRTESVFLAVWSFVLVQAMHVLIPAYVSRWTENQAADLPADDPNHGFENAFRAADEALHRIAGRS